MKIRLAVVVAAAVATLGMGVAGAQLTIGPPETVPPEEAQVPEGLPQLAQDGIVKAEANQEAAQAFTSAMRAWAACVGEHAPLHDEATGDFDPESVCGEKPTPTLPDGNDGNGSGEPNGGAETGQEASEFGKSTAEEARSGREGFGQSTAEEARSGREGFGQSTAEDARPEGAGPPRRPDS